jgi:hypothetical protein
MFLKIEDNAGPVCVNMDTGLRFRPKNNNGVESGVTIIFPDGNTNITVRGNYDRVCDALGAKDGVQ